jgi:hypothetical protein
VSFASRAHLARAECLAGPGASNTRETPSASTAPRLVTLVLLGLALTAAGASAQVTPKKRPAKPAAEGAAQTVEIRGQVPTPQVVTVRPRAVPDYSRGVLVPAFYDEHFWPSILAPYRVVPNLNSNRVVLTLPSESAHRPPEAAPDTAAAAPLPREKQP